MAKLVKRPKSQAAPKGPAIITVFTYNESSYTEKVVKDAAECVPPQGSNTVSWVNIDGLGQPDIIDAISARYLVHHLVQEDILDINQRPKAEDFGDYIYLSAKMLSYDDAKDDITEEQVSIILGGQFVITIQERPGDVFDGIRERIRAGKGRVRKMGADYLACSLLGAIVDHYFVILEKLGERIEALEETLMTSPDAAVLRAINKMKRNLIFLRKSVWPMREVIRDVRETDSPLMRKATMAYYRDIYDHVIQAVDTIEAFRDTVSGMLDIYLSSLSNRMNQIMKVLTIIATIFMPLTFIAGVYGMNFNTRISPFNMPELNWPFGYVWALGLMAVSVAGMLFYFKKKRWF